MQLGTHADTLTAYADALRSWDSPGRVVSVALDLRGRGDARPAAYTLLTEALSAVGFPPVHPLGEQIGTAVRTAKADGAEGLFIASDAEGRYWVEVATPWPPRNDVRVGDAPWLVEVERLRYLSGQPVVVVDVELHSAHITRIAAMAAQTAESIHDPRGTRSVHGRTATEGRGDAGTGLGGHSRNRADHIVEEHRTAAGRDAARAIESLLRSGDLLVVAGVAEARAHLLAELPPLVAQAALTQHAPGPEADRHWPTALAFAASERCRVEAGDALAGSWVRNPGSFVRGVSGVAEAASQMKVAELVIHEDAVAHWGTALDARRHAGIGSDEAINRALRATVSSGGIVAFCRWPKLLEEHQGVAARLRW